MDGSKSVSSSKSSLTSEQQACKTNYGLVAPACPVLAGVI
jgi:hypothetical protein